MEHIQDYYIEGASHFAKDAGISRSALSRLMRGESSPSYALVCALTKALEQKLGHRIDPRELISVDGTFLTPSICELVLCNGCLPDCLYDEEDNVKPEYRHIRSGQWSREASLEGDNLIAVEQEQEAL
jgi:transcriptional regulator with XRE-family HTH domain